MVKRLSTGSDFSHIGCVSSSEIEDIGLVEEGKEDAAFTSEHAEFEVFVEQCYTEIYEFEEKGRVLATWLIITTMRDRLDNLRIYFGYRLETWGP